MLWSHALNFVVPYSYYDRPIFLVFCSHIPHRTRVSDRSNIPQNGIGDYVGLYILQRLKWEGSREPQEYSRNILAIYLPGSICSDYVPTLLLGVPIFVPFYSAWPETPKAERWMAPP